jgi:low temperature requirement protein LtrA
MSLARASLWIFALGFGAFGTAYAGWPTAMAALTGVALPSPTARIDFAATYGGFQLGFAVFLWLCVRRGDPASVRLGLLASGCALSGFGIVRLTSLLLHPGAGAVIYAGLAIETAGAALALWARSRLPPSRVSHRSQH